MDNEYQDIHYKKNKCSKDLFVRRHIEIRNMSFKDGYIEIDFIEINPITLAYGSTNKTIIIPKLEGYSLIID